MAETAPTAHSIGLAKLIVDDLKAAKDFYQTLFGMQETKYYDYAPETFTESIMSFESGASLALFAPNPKAEQPLKKSLFPVVLIYSPEFEQLTARIKAAGHPIQVLGKEQTGGYRVAIARDPSGNAVEIFARPGDYAVGGSKLIVDDREAAEQFYSDVFGAVAGQRYNTPMYDEVLMNFAEGPFLALFQPLQENPLPKSRFPQTAIYTEAFDQVVARLDEQGLGYRKVETQTPGLNIIIARDPAGNAIEIISR